MITDLNTPIPFQTMSNTEDVDMEDTPDIEVTRWGVRPRPRSPRIRGVTQLPLTKLNSSQEDPIVLCSSLFIIL